MLNLTEEQIQAARAAGRSRAGMTISLEDCLAIVDPDVVGDLERKALAYEIQAYTAPKYNP